MFWNIGKMKPLNIPPCYCGGTTKIKDYSTGFRICCDGCRHETDFHLYRFGKFAVMDWNGYQRRMRRAAKHRERIKARLNMQEPDKDYSNAIKELELELGQKGE